MYHIDKIIETAKVHTTHMCKQHILLLDIGNLFNQVT